MAKSLRSKWVRKCKREKRVRYGKKELAVLLARTKMAKQNDVVVRDASEVVQRAKSEGGPANGEAMEVATAESSTHKSSKPTLKTLVKEHGAVPKWIHPRKVKKIKKQFKRSKINKSKK